MAARETMDRSTLIEWYRRNRQRSAALFDLVSDEAYYARPISLRHPLVFYEGHLPGFSFNTLVKRGLGLPSIDSRLETLFARGIDPAENQDSGAARDAGWPTRETVRQFAAEADRQVIDPAIRFSIVARRPSPFSSTRRCTRKRSCTCGIVCRSTRSAGRPATHH
jgi:hypothetical protein